MIKGVIKIKQEAMRAKVRLLNESLRPQWASGGVKEESTRKQRHAFSCVHIDMPSCVQARGQVVPEVPSSLLFETEHLPGLRQLTDPRMQLPASPVLVSNVNWSV